MPLALTGVLQLASGSVTGRIEDLSMAGAFMVADVQVEAGSEGPLTMTFGSAADALTLHAQARVVRCAEAGIGLRFVEVDLETYHHLRGLVLNNSEDYAAVRDEIEAHRGLKAK